MSQQAETHTTCFFLTRIMGGNFNSLNDYKAIKIIVQFHKNKTLSFQLFLFYYFVKRHFCVLHNMSTTIVMRKEVKFNKWGLFLIFFYFYFDVYVYCAIMWLLKFVPKGFKIFTFLSKKVPKFFVNKLNMKSIYL